MYELASTLRRRSVLVAVLILAAFLVADPLSASGNGTPDGQLQTAANKGRPTKKTPSPTSSPLPSATSTATPTEVATLVPTETPTSTVSPTATQTQVPAATPTSTPPPAVTSTPTQTVWNLGWTRIAGMSVPRAYLGVAPSGGSIYAVGGMVMDATGTTSAVARVEQYEQSTQFWSKRAELGLARSNLGVAEVNGKVYAIGGAPEGPYGSTVTSVVEEYDTVSGVWRRVADLPDQRMDIAAAPGPNGRVYVFGGLSPQYNSAAAYEYDPALDSWTSLPGLPHRRERAAASLGPDGKIYVVGGDDPLDPNRPGFVAAVDVFDPVTVAWSSVAPMPAGLSLATAVWTGGKLYVIGTKADKSGPSETVERYDPGTDSWTYDTSLSAATRGAGAAVGPDGEIYAVGGANPNGVPLSIVEVGRPAPPASPTATATATYTPAPTSTPTMTATAVPGQERMAVAYQVNPAHDGNQRLGAPNVPLARQWSVDLGQPVSYPLIARGKVFVTVRNAESAGYGTSLHAIDALTGASAWGPIPLGGTYWWSGITYDDGRVFAVNEDGVVRAFQSDTGELLWERKVGLYNFTSLPVALQEIVYVQGAGSGSGSTVYALDSVSGALLWSRDLFYGGGDSSPALSADRLFVSYACENTYSLDRWSGAKVWEYSLGVYCSGGWTPVYHDERLYTRYGRTQYTGTIFDAKSGAPLGSYEISLAPAFSGDSGYFFNQGTVSARDIVTNTVTWTFTGDGTLITAPLVAGSTVFVGGTSGNLYGLDIASGQVVWSDRLPAGISISDIPGTFLTGLNAGEGLLVVPAGNTLTAYGSSTGPVGP